MLVPRPYFQLAKIRKNFLLIRLKVISNHNPDMSCTFRGIIVADKPVMACGPFPLFFRHHCPKSFCLFNNAGKPRHISLIYAFRFAVSMVISNIFKRLAFCGRACDIEPMNDLVKQDMIENIVLDLLSGQNPDTIVLKHGCELSQVMQIMGSNVFSERIKEHLERDLQVSGLIALKNIKNIASDNTISKATQLKANQWIAEKALELNRLGASDESPATMTQDQLARRLKALQSEAVKRAKPIDTGVLDNMME